MTKEEKIAQYKQIGFSWAIQQKEFRMLEIKIADGPDSLLDAAPAYPPMKEYRKALCGGYMKGLLIAQDRGDFYDTEKESARDIVGRMAAKASSIMHDCDVSYGDF